MKTELLNEYIFADLLHQYAQISRKQRQNIMEKEGISHEEIISTPLLPHDITSGLETLDYFRAQSLIMLSRAKSDSQE